MAAWAASLSSPGVAPDDGAHLAAVELLRERRHGRHGREREEPVQLPRRLRDELPVALHDRDGVVERPERRAGDDRAHRVQPVAELGDDAEVAAAAADRPEQVRVLVGAGGDLRAVGEDDVRAEQVVDREAVLAGQVADAAAERQSADAGGAQDAERRGHADLGRGGVDLGQGRASSDGDRASGRVDRDRRQRREVDHDAVVDRAEAGGAVAAAADRERDVVGAGEADPGRHVVGAGCAEDDAGRAVDHAVVDRAGPRRSRSPPAR